MGTSFINRRLFTRAPSEARFLVDGPEPTLGRVQDISFGGARLLLRGKPAVGQVLPLLPVQEIGSGITCRVQVRWRRSYCKGWQEAGGSLEGSMTEILESWLGEPLARLEFDLNQVLERRRLVRFDVDEETEVLGDGWLIPVRLIDLSLGGARLVSEELWPAAERVQLALGSPPAMLGSRLVSPPRANGYGWRYSLRFEGIREEKMAQAFLDARLTPGQR
ncbi:MAG: PilZ domain-containing protein [Armatimonadetes bacterium]|nr:PilZ domain-containing protein [Armatimonadota bacterium]